MVQKRRRRTDVRQPANVTRRFMQGNIALDFDGVARRAYELYQQRGGEHGHDWNDWFQAEREIRGRSGERLN